LAYFPEAVSGFMFHVSSSKVERLVSTIEVGTVAAKVKPLLAHSVNSLDSGRDLRGTFGHEARRKEIAVASPIPARPRNYENWEMCSRNDARSRMSDLLPNQEVER